MLDVMERKIWKFRGGTVNMSGGRIVRFELDGRRPRGGAERRFLDGFTQDMKFFGVESNVEVEMVRWREMIGCGH